MELKQYGFTVGCPGCRAANLGTTPVGHSDECRKRIEDALIEEGGAKAKLMTEGICDDSEIIDGTGPGREILLGGVVPVIDQVESWLRDAAGSRAPEGFNG